MQIGKEQDDSSQDADHGYQFNNIGFIDDISIFDETLVPRTPVWNMPQSSQKMHVHLRKPASATVQQILRHANHCNPSCNLSSAQEIARIHANPLCRAALSHRHHLIIRLGPGPIQFVYGSH